MKTNEQMIGEHRVFFEKNTYIVESPVNLTFDELQDLDDDQFVQWVKDVRAEVKRIWDTYEIPPRSAGRTREGIEDQFNKMLATSAYKIEEPDDIIVNRTCLGSAADQFFPGMYKARINRNKHDDGYSIYDLFGDDYEEVMLHRSKRHFRRDSFYHYAYTLLKNDDTYGVIKSESAIGWIKAYKKNPHIFRDVDFFIECIKTPDGMNDGYFQIDTGNTLTMSFDVVKSLYDRDFLYDRNVRNLNMNGHTEGRVYCIRVYRKGQRIFPKGLIPFRIGYSQPAVNFPPFTARYLYERFTEHLTDQDRIVVYDPSAGWGGRILGAMSVKDDRKIHYVGTDPNPDNHFPDYGTSRYECLADFFNSCTVRGNSVFSDANTYRIFSEGSEEIHKDEAFQEYKGQVDLVFTSPPYFNREAYCEDPKQSYKKFGSSYKSWKKGYLEPTLRTCFDWMKPGAYLLWNIADLQMGKTFLPLEKDSCDILEDLGFEQVTTLKMTLESMPGGNRVDENGVPTHTRVCHARGRHWKYEPIFVYRKPLTNRQP